MILLFAFIVYIAVRLVSWLSTWTHPAVRVLAVVVYAALTLSIFFLIFTFDGAWAAIGRTIGAYWLGIFLYLSLSVVLIDVILLVARLITRPEKEKWKRVRFASGWVIVCLTACISIYGFLNADNPRVVSYEVDLSSNATETHLIDASQDRAGAEPMRIVLITDTHLGAQGTEARLPRIVEMINAQDPDMVLIAGDVFNGSILTIDSPETVAENLRAINAPKGVFACLGNHDGGYGFDETLEVLKQGNVTLLREDFAIVDDACIIVGREDGNVISYGDGLRRGTYDAIVDRIGTQDLPIIVIDHNPIHIDEYASDVSLVVCGHTHDGQVFPLTLVTYAMYVCDYGIYQRDANSPFLIVTSGVDYWGTPMRVGSTPEIAVIDALL